MNALAGTGGLIRLILRRDRILLPVWTVVLAVLPLTYMSATAGLYHTAAARQAYAESIEGNSAELALLGPVFGSSTGALGAWRSGAVFALVALASLLTVIRHTRTEEEAGRRELLGSAVVGRHAPLSAALVVTLGADLVLAAVVAGGLAGQGLPVGGSVALGLALAAAGWMFAAAAGLAAQLTVGAGAARAVAVAALGLSYLVRAVGDAGGEGGGLSRLSWTSPIGWAHRVRPFAGDRWWIFGLVAGFVVVPAAAAYALSARRDLGAGIVPPRPGRATASPRLRTPLGLAWRLHRGLLIGWTAGFAVVGAAFGGAATTAGDQLNQSPELVRLFERLGGTAGISDIYLSAVLGILALAASGYAIQATLRLRSEEVGLRAEPVLATSAGRLRWAASHLVFSCAGPAAALAAAGLAAGLAYGSSTGDVGRQLPRVLGGALVQLPAVWVLAGIAVALFGLLPRLVVAMSWAALAVCLLLGQLGAVLRLDQQVLDTSPFTHVPKVPGGDVSSVPLLWLLAVSAALTAAGLAGFRRRDVG